MELLLDEVGQGTLSALLPRPKEQCAPQLAWFPPITVRSGEGVSHVVSECHGRVQANISLSLNTPGSFQGMREFLIVCVATAREGPAFAVRVSGLGVNMTKWPGTWKDMVTALPSLIL